MVATKATSGRTTRTRSATRARVGRSTGVREAGVTLAEIEMNSSPMINWTSVSKKGRRAGMSKPRMLAAAMPVTIAAMSPVSSRTMSQPADTAITVASCASVPSVSPSRSTRRVSHSSASPTAPPTRPTAMLRRNWPIWYPRPMSIWCVVATAWNTTAPRMAPIGSVSVPSQISRRRTLSVGRTYWSSGPTTVGPDTTRIMPTIADTLRDMLNRAGATAQTARKVKATPKSSSLPTTARVCPVRLRRSRPRPAS